MKTQHLLARTTAQPSVRASVRRAVSAIVATGLAAGLLGVGPMAGTASAAGSAPKPACAAGSCTITYVSDGSARQTFTVPAGVSSLKVTAEGAAGGGEDELSPGVPAGLGGRTVGTVAVTPGTTLSILVGTAGESRSHQQGQGRAGGVGGGGAGGANTQGPVRGGGGGGGSFLYGAAGDTLLAAGGGGGAGLRSGGAGGTATADGEPGDHGGGGGSSTQPGQGTRYDDGFEDGTAGTATTTSFGVGTGGRGGDLTDPQFVGSGAGGGGGYTGGGGGRSRYSGGGGGGGGGGYAAPGVMVDAVSSRAGVRSGDGYVTIWWIDDLAPAIERRGDITAAATSASGAAVSYTPPRATDASDDDVRVTCTPASGTRFAIGATTVACTAVDGAGNAASSDFTVVVTDTNAPVIQARDDLTVTATPGATTATVTYSTPTAIDAVDGPVNVSCLPPSGSSFAIGTTSVVCSAADRANNRASTTFTVTVRAAAPTPAKSDVKAVVAGPTIASVGSKITYTMKITNTGPSAATGLTSVLGASGLTGVTASTGGSTGSALIAAQQLSGTKWVTSSLASGQSITVTITGTVAVKKGQSVMALGGAASSISDPNLGNNLATTSTKAS